MGKVQRPQLPCVYLMTPGIGRPDRGPRHVCNVPTVCQCSRRPDVTMLDVMRPGSRGHSRHSRPGGRSVSRPLASDQSAEKRQGQILHDKDSLSLSYTHTAHVTAHARHRNGPLITQNFKTGPSASLVALPPPQYVGIFPPLGEAASGCSGGRVRWVAWRNGARSHALLHLTLSPGNLLPPKNCARPITAF